MGGARSIHGETISTEFQSEYEKGRDHLSNLATNGRIILKWILMK
jgi:hypothetical protein